MWAAAWVPVELVLGAAAGPSTNQSKDFSNQ